MILILEYGFFKQKQETQVRCLTKSTWVSVVFGNEISYWVFAA